MKPSTHRPPTPAQIEHRRVSDLERTEFFDNLELILTHEEDILLCEDYFFCRSNFANYGVYSHGDINVGTLLLGWRDGIFIDHCRSGGCNGKSYVYKFGGLLSGTGWSGYCSKCGNTKFVWESTHTMARMRFAYCSNQQFKDHIKAIQNFRVNTTYFGVPDFDPEMKTKKVARSAANVISMPELISELQSDRIRKPTPGMESLIEEFLTVDNLKNGPDQTIEIFRSNSNRLDYQHPLEG
jgi:hypothetical protein